MKIAYVILHYLADIDTIECIDSIIKATSESIHEKIIIVVDNNSPNNSFCKVKNAFFENKQVIFIQNKENLGFARGNNVGFLYAKYTYGADFVVQINNDTIIKQKDFQERLVSKYKKKRYAVLGPDIISSDGYHQNPGRKQGWTNLEIELFIIKKRIKILTSYFGKNISSLNDTSGDYWNSTVEGDVEDTILHGACLIFSPDYIKKFDGMCDETFLYWEEDILKLQSDICGFKMLYSSDLEIYHKEDAATNLLPGTDLEKIRRKFKLLIASAKIYRKIKNNAMINNKVLPVIEKTVTAIKKEKYEIDADTPILYLLRIVLSRGIMLIRGTFNKIGLKSAGKTVFIGNRVKLRCKAKMSIGTGVTIGDNVYIDALSKKGLTLGDGVNIGAGTVIRCSGNFKKMGVGFVMGDNSSLADNCFVGATGGVWIGNDVIGGQNIRFHSSNHNFRDTKVLIRKQGISAKGIRVGNNCWIGAGVVFCDGVTVEDGCVIAANSVVTKSFPENSIIAGCPAKIIGKR